MLYGKIVKALLISFAMSPFDAIKLFKALVDFHFLQMWIRKMLRDGYVHVPSPLMM